MLRTLFVLIVAAASSAFFGLAVFMIGTFRSTSIWIDRCTRAWARSIVRAAGIKLNAENLGRIDSDRRFILVANHHSYLDIPCLLAIVPHPLRFFAKVSLFSIPFFGWGLRAAGFIPIDRKNRKTAVQSFDLAASRVRKGNTIVVFPEEGRTRTRELKAFQRGAFLLALRSGLPILPVAIDGTFEVLPVGRSRVHPGRVTIRIGEPIETEGLSIKAREELTASTRQMIRAMLFGELSVNEPVPDDLSGSPLMSEPAVTS